MTRKKVAVFFGGESFEHDVSILTGIQACQVMDITKYEPIPVYVSKQGRIFTGERLLATSTYPVGEYGESKLREVFIPVGEGSCLAYRGLFGLHKIPFDVAFLAFHGAAGESGAFQGLFEAAGIPYTGASVKASAIYMDKVLTKRIARDLGIDVLDEVIIPKPAEDFADIKKYVLGIAGKTIKYPLMVKPMTLGSSVGIHKAGDFDELCAACLDIFKLGDGAMAEPFVENLVEYNISVLRRDGATITSAIEMPTNKGEALSFSDKYLSAGASKKKGLHISAMPTDAIINSRREFSPKMTAKQETFIRESAGRLYDALGSTGAPRIDFLANAKTGEIWMNEANPIPGAYAFYLWENSKFKISYQELVSILIEGANEPFAAADLRLGGSVIFKERG